MRAAGLVARLREHGYVVVLDGAEIVIRPRPDDATITEMRANKPAIVAYLSAVQPASDHRYVLRRGADDPSRSVCIACGLPAVLHGARALDGALIVDNVNDVALLAARAVVAVAIAQAAGR